MRKSEDFVITAGEKLATMRLDIFFSIFSIFLQNRDIDWGNSFNQKHLNQQIVKRKHFTDKVDINSDNWIKKWLTEEENTYVHMG